MKKVIGIIITLVVFSCSPKLKSKIATTLPPLDDNALIVVLDITDDQTISGDIIGNLEAKDSGLAVNCTYYENIKNLKALARAEGANLIKITEHKLPDGWSTCHRLKATIYNVNQPKSYETQIEWRADRKLTWDDFKGEPDLENFPNALALTNSGFGYESGISMFKQGEVFVQSVFYNNSSWVLPEGRNDYVLRHEQIHFDITEIYSRKLRKALADSKVTSDDMLRAKVIFDQIFQELQKRQDKYDRETKHGDKKHTQENWEAIVELELEKYALYRAPD
ncbi:DUF922 domain-containing protein [Winogradskyella aurantia]|uniref:DUF922 domain-containing protein n=1 Tax=Winogradskyella aurantia TaxID=1915063 RepID=UPI000D7CC30B|nr:DUF922 domain-containing protein [Winogradskyella aurantia]